MQCAWLKQCRSYLLQNHKSNFDIVSSHKKEHRLHIFNFKVQFLIIISFYSVLSDRHTINSDNMIYSTFTHTHTPTHTKTHKAGAREYSRIYIQCETLNRLCVVMVCLGPVHLQYKSSIKQLN